MNCKIKRTKKVYTGCKKIGYTIRPDIRSIYITFYPNKVFLIFLSNIGEISSYITMISCIDFPEAFDEVNETKYTSFTYIDLP